MESRKQYRKRHHRRQVILISGLLSLLLLWGIWGLASLPDRLSPMAKTTTVTQQLDQPWFRPHWVAVNQWQQMRQAGNRLIVGPGWQAIMLNQVKTKTSRGHWLIIRRYRFKNQSAGRINAAKQFMIITGLPVVTNTNQVTLVDQELQRSSVVEQTLRELWYPEFRHQMPLIVANGQAMDLLTVSMTN